LSFVGYYLSSAGLVTLIALLLIKDNSEPPGRK
jgi:hypothetical protein